MIRPRRSALFMPGSNARAIEKARELLADAFIIDLEDAVAPDAKPAARAAAVAAIGAGGFGGREVVLRLNHRATEWFAEDISAVAAGAPDAVLVPKVDGPEDVRAVLAALGEAGAPRTLALWCMLETPRGVLAAGEIGTVSPRVECLVAGTQDLASAARMRPGADRAELVPALSQCVLAARAAGIDALDGVHTTLQDEEGLRAACEQGRALGFDGKTLIHPSQIPICNAAFSPDEQELTQAKRLVDAWQQATDRGEGIAVVDGRMIERLHVDDARRTLTLAAAIAALG